MDVYMLPLLQPMGFVTSEPRALKLRSAPHDNPIINPVTSGSQNFHVTISLVPEFKQVENAVTGVQSLWHTAGK
jgi:hypothetical protein